VHDCGRFQYSVQGCSGVVGLPSPSTQYGARNAASATHSLISAIYCADVAPSGMYRDADTPSHATNVTKKSPPPWQSNPAGQFSTNGYTSDCSEYLYRFVCSQSTATHVRHVVLMVSQFSMPRDATLLFLRFLRLEHGNLFGNSQASRL